MPRAVKARYHATTDAVGLAKFPPLPLGMLAQFILTDQISKPTKFGLGDLRGGQWAPLAAEDAFRLRTPSASKNITLVPPIRLEGKITLPDGSAQGNVLVLARRINAAEAAGHDDKREQLIAQTRSNARGQYVMAGLRPGRYYVWTYPEKRLTRDYASEVFQRDLNDKINRVDFQLSRGAIIQGVVVAQKTGNPVKGQTMWLFDSQENNQYAITDARGYFKFRALGGQQRLRVHANGFNSPPPGLSLPAQSEFNFSLKNGEKRDFKIALPGTPVTSPIRGVVLLSNGQAAAGATVDYRTVDSYSSDLKQVTTNAQGKFVLPARASLKPAQLFADKGELATPFSVIAVPGQAVQLQLAPNAWASIQGHVTDEKNQPVAGAEIHLSLFYGSTGFGVNKTTTDARGFYRYEHLHPGVGVQVGASKSGYTDDFEMMNKLQTGETLRLDFSLKRAPLTIKGILYGLDGKPARNYQAWVSGLSRPVQIGNDGRFFFPHVTQGPVDIQVAPAQGFSDYGKWKPFRATGGDQNVVLRLKNRQKDERFSDFEQPKRSIDPANLIGQIAPPLRATRWSGNRSFSLAQLRGKTVLLVFSGFLLSNDGEVSDFARSFPAVQTIGIKLESDALINSKLRSSADEIARKLGFPIAVDAAIPARKFKGWQTFQSYGQSRYAVIGRDGRVLYAGDELDRAIELATAAP